MSHRSVYRPFPAWWFTVCLIVGGIVCGGLDAAIRGPADAMAGEIVTGDGTPHVVNSEQPAAGEETLRLRELWRVSSEDEGDFLLGRIQRVLVGPEGHFYLLDQQLSQVHVFSADGEYVHSLSREGDGPGESRRPMDLIFTPAGGLGLVQAFPASVIAIDLDGNPQPAIELRGPPPDRSMDRYALRVRYRGGTFAYSGRTFSMGEDGARPRNMLVTCDEQGGEQSVLLEMLSTDLMETRRWVEKDEYFTHRCWEIGPRGNLYTVPKRDAYAIHIYAPDGALQRVIERPFESRRRTAEDKQDLGPQISANGVEIEIDKVIEDRDPCVSRLHVADNGELWVEHSMSNENQPAGVWQTLDVFDAEGHYDRRVAIAGPIDRQPDEDRLFRVSDDRMVLIKGFDPRISITIGGGGDDIDVPEEERPPLEVICLAIEPAS
jgi:hypothetical protein